MFRRNKAQSIKFLKFSLFFSDFCLIIDTSNMANPEREEQSAISLTFEKASEKKTHFLNLT